MGPCKSCENEPWCSQVDPPKGYTCYKPKKKTDDVRVCRTCLSTDKWELVEKPIGPAKYITLKCKCGDILHVKIDLALAEFRDVLLEAAHDIHAFNEMTGLDIDVFAEPQKKKRMSNFDKY